MLIRCLRLACPVRLTRAGRGGGRGVTVVSFFPPWDMYVRYRGVKLNEGVASNDDVTCTRLFVLQKCVCVFFFSGEFVWQLSMISHNLQDK